MAVDPRIQLQGVRPGYKAGLSVEEYRCQPGFTPETSLNIPL